MTDDQFEIIVSMAERGIGSPAEMPDSTLRICIAKALHGYFDAEQLDDLFKLKTCALFFLLPEFRRRQRERAKVGVN